MADNAETPNIRHTTDRSSGPAPAARALRVATIIVTVAVGMFAALNIHELGHTAVAWLAGDHHASYELRCAPAGFGCNHFDASGMSVPSKLAVCCGGCLVTQIIAWSLVLVRRRAGRRWRLVLTPLIAVFAVDLLLQFLQAIFTPLPEYDLTKVDFTAAATLLDWSQSFSLVVFVTGTLAYIAVWVRLGYRSRP
ncbi:hypothetical protein Amsp01_089120 [Amycolatopsis sp. NBRC 101858]|uniref:hypothetical protein n=1 Tax=Amycolatopsis sp. NBRC 101858 TaxID=3032200 RepID=UPI0024A2DBDF|nr:hypothetical protein [Amycolatopsis sp. NBRC 101858]GLY42889.1 hypothetical protein Amsp01_089120 [Amycolatopsis sp. NBRC 101858]